MGVRPEFVTELTRASPDGMKPAIAIEIKGVAGRFFGLRDRMGNKGLQWRILFTRDYYEQ